MSSEVTLRQSVEGNAMDLRGGEQLCYGAVSA